MVRVPTEKRYEEHIERELNSLLDDGLPVTTSEIRD